MNLEIKIYFKIKYSFQLIIMHERIYIVKIVGCHGLLLIYARESETKKLTLPRYGSFFLYLKKNMPVRH
jgi:hypothetical protein